MNRALSYVRALQEVLSNSERGVGVGGGGEVLHLLRHCCFDVDIKFILKLPRYVPTLVNDVIPQLDVIRNQDIVTWRLKDEIAETGRRPLLGYGTVSTR
jgi:hypothetical protein